MSGVSTCTYLRMFKGLYPNMSEEATVRISQGRKFNEPHMLVEAFTGDPAGVYLQRPMKEFRVDVSASSQRFVERSVQGMLDDFEPFPCITVERTFVPTFAHYMSRPDDAAYVYGDPEIMFKVSYATPSAFELWIDTIRFILPLRVHVIVNQSVINYGDLS